MPNEIVRRSIIVSYQDNSKQFIAGQKQVKKSTSALTKGLKVAAAGVLAFATAGAALSALKDAARTVSEFQTSLRGLESLTGLSREAVAGLGDTAVEMSARFGTSAKELLDGFAKVGSAAPQLLGNADALAEVTKQADILSKAAGITLDESIDAVTKTMNQYGLEASQAAEIADIFATSQQKGTARVTELVESMKNVGSVAAAQNISLEDTNAHLQALAKGGLSGAEAGTKLRAVYLSLAKTGRDDLNPATQDFGDILNTLGKEVTTVNQAQKIFGKETAAAALTLIKQKDVVAELSGNLHETGNAMSQASINTDTVAVALEKSAAAWDALILSIEDGSGIISRSFGRLIHNTTQFILGLKNLNEAGGEFTNSFLDNFSVIGRASGEFNRAQDAFKSFIGDRDSLEGLKLENDVLKAQIAIAEELKSQTAAGVEGDKERAEIQKELNRVLFQKEQVDKQIAFLTIDAKENNDDLNGTLDEQVATLGSLKKALAAANKEREGIAETDKAALAANEEVIRSLTKRIAALKVSTKAIKDNTEENRKNAEQAIKALQVSLIEDEPARQIATLELKAEVDIDKATGSDEQIAEQKKLIEQKLRNDISAIVQAGLDKDLEAIKAALQAEKDFKAQQVIDLQAGLDKQQEDAEKASDAALQTYENGLNKQSNLILENVAAGVTTEQEGQFAIMNNELKILKARSLNANLTRDEQLAAEKAFIEAKIALGKAETEANKAQQAARLQAVQQSVAQITSLLSRAFSREKERINASIEVQKERVKKATQIAGDGNAEMLQIEEERLEKLNAAKEKAVKKEKALAAIQLAINAALAVSQTILTITKGGSQGGIFGVIAAGIALAATIAAAVIGIKSTLSDVPAFAEGVDLIKGKGTAKSDSIHARVSVGEGVIPADNNAALLKTGIGVTDKRLPSLVQAGLDADSIKTPSIASNAFTSSQMRSQSNKGIEQKLDQNTKAIKDLNFTAEINHDQIKLKNKKQSVKDRRNKQRKR